MAEVRSFFAARQQILASLDHPQPVRTTELVTLGQALGRVLAGPVVATVAVPGYDNSAMDGYGVRVADLSATAETLLSLGAVLPAGVASHQPLAPGTAVRIFTGAPVPAGCDAVVMQEQVRRAGEQVVIPPGVIPGQNIRRAGEDIAAGRVVLPQGRRLRPPDIGLLAAIGLDRVPVYGRLTVAVLSTGDELVAPGSPLQPGTIHESNRPTLIAALQALGVRVLDLGIVGDDRELLAASLQRGAAEADVLISSGGVSVGDYDLVREVVDTLGVIDFWTVAMKPGKPQAYGRLGRAWFCGLPGNPVSSLAVFLLLVRPALLKLMGAQEEPVRRLWLPLTGPSIHRTASRHAGFIEFQRGVVHFDADEARVETTGAQGSGILTSMAQANAFLVLPDTVTELHAGDRVETWLIDYA
jgi:molybdopterin molybdotransferase